MENPLLDFFEYAPSIARDRDTLPPEQPHDGFDTFCTPNRIQLFSNDASYRISAGLIQDVKVKFDVLEKYYSIDVFLDGEVSGFEKVSQWIPLDYAEIAKDLSGQYAVIYSKYGEFTHDGTTGFFENCLWLENGHRYIFQSDELSR